MGLPSILITCENPRNWGGIRAMTATLAGLLTARGHRVTLAYPAHLRAAFAGLTEHEVDGVPALRVPALSTIEAYAHASMTRRLRPALEDHDMHVSVGGSALAAMPFLLADRPYVCWMATLLRDEKAGQGRRSLLTKAGIYLMLNDLFLRAAESREAAVLRGAAHVGTVSKYTRSTVLDTYGLPADTVTAIPYPVETDLFQPTDGASDGPPYLFLAGRSEDPRKNVPMLLRALRTARETYPELTLKVSGRVPRSPRLYRIIEDLELENAVEFLGVLPREELPRWFSGAELFVLSSLQEGLGLAVLEAMSCGTPVVCTRCGGPEEIVEDGETGRLVPNDDAEAFAEAVVDLLGDDARRREMGRAAREHVLQHYAAEPVVDQFVAVFRQVWPQHWDTPGK
jgi:glycosyltransferase involved in cell wall biosynthesis